METKVKNALTAALKFLKATHALDQSDARQIKRIIRQLEEALDALEEPHE
jgi:hypothetical protein